MAGKKTIVICCSAAFYRHANQVAEELQAMGYKAVVPVTAEKMKKEANYDVARIKTWRLNPKHYSRKQRLAGRHFKEVAQGDAVLILNDDKPGQPRYIGPNTTMEWGLAYYLGKPIFIFNDVDSKHTAHEEVYGMSTSVLGADLAKIKL